MTQQKKQQRKSGKIGHLHFSDGNSKFQQVNFPDTKDECELFLANTFLNKARELNTFETENLSLLQNEQDEFDFILNIDGIQKSLELKELHLPGFKGNFEIMPEGYNCYTYAKYIFDKIIMKNSIRYGNIKGLYLLMYTTHYKFTLNNTVLNLLQYWTLIENNNFERIFYYRPTKMSELYRIKPYPATLNSKEHFITEFNPELYKENVCINFDSNDMTIIKNKNKTFHCISPDVPIELIEKLKKG